MNLLIFVILNDFFFAGTFMRNVNLLIEVIKTKSLTLLDQLEVNVTKETNKWSDIKTEFNECLVSYLKESESNRTLFKHFAEQLEDQSNAIETSNKELRELVIILIINKLFFNSNFYLKKQFFLKKNYFSFKIVKFEYFNPFMK